MKSETLSGPFQIYSEVSNTGKNIMGRSLLHWYFAKVTDLLSLGTKKKIKWRFGWSNSDEVHEVELIHSVISGKKVIIIHILIIFYLILFYIRKFWKMAKL